jgi:hypothetical protein
MRLQGSQKYEAVLEQRNLPRKCLNGFSFCVQLPKFLIRTQRFLEANVSQDMYWTIDYENVQ